MNTVKTLKYNKKQLYIILLAIGMLVFTLVSSIIMDDYNDNTKIFFCYLTIIDFVFSIILWYALYRELLAPVPLIIISLYLFNLGYSVLWIQNQVFYMEITSLLIIIRAQKYLLLCMNMFFVGCLLHKREDIQYDLKIENDSLSICSDEALKATMLIVLICSFLPYLINLYRLLINSITHGYSYIYSAEYNNSSNTLLTIIGNLFEPALLGLIVVLKNERTKKILIIFSIVFIGLKFLIGARADGVAFVISLMMLFYFENKKINIKQLLIYFVSGYILASFIAITRDVRAIANRSVGDYFGVFISLKDLANEFFKEFGSSITPTLYTISLVPKDYPFRYGISYFASVLSIIPNIGFWSVHPAEKYSALASWVTKAANHTWSGLGYSSTAEAYINFGMCGCLVFIIWGYIIAKIIFDCKNSEKKSSLRRYLISSMFLCVYYCFVRSDFRDMIRALTWRILPILFVYWIIFRRLKKRINDCKKNN